MEEGGEAAGMENAEAPPAAEAEEADDLVEGMMAAPPLAGGPAEDDPMGDLEPENAGPPHKRQRGPRGGKRTHGRR